MSNFLVQGGAPPDDSVTTVKVKDDAVTLAKMAGLARGKIIYGDSSGNPAVLAVGSSGQSLTSDGTDISWGSGGGLNHISTTTIGASVASVVINYDETAYSNFLMKLQSIDCVTTNGHVQLRWSDDDGTTWSSSHYGYYDGGGRDGNTFSGGMSAATHCIIAPNVSDSSGMALSIDVYFQVKYADAHDQVSAHWLGNYGRLTSLYNSAVRGAVHCNDAGFNTAIEISNSAGNIDGGVIDLYGYSEA